MIRITGNRVLIELAEIKEKVVNGIVMPEQAQGKPEQGLVLQSGVKGINKGDTVVFPTYAGMDVKSDDKSYIILKEMDILATLNNDVFRIIGDKILLKIEEAPETMKCGNIELHTAPEYRFLRTHAVYGTVKQTGDIDWSKVGFQVKKGDKVVVQQHIGFQVKLDGIEHRLIDPENVLGIV